MGDCASKQKVKNGEGAAEGESYERIDGAHPDFGLKATHEVVRFLGRGGTGDTWLFRDKATEELVAIKLIKRPILKVIMPNILREITVRFIHQPQ